jgi:hypothetical protein
MAYSSTELIGADLYNVDTTKSFPLGTMVDAIDPTYGMGRFIYLAGVASVVAGDVVKYDEAFATTRAVAATRGPLAVALAAVDATTEYGWFQVQGVATVSVLAGDVADALQYLTATAGSIDDAVVATQKIDGLLSMAAVGTPSANKAYCLLAFPCANGNG